MNSSHLSEGAGDRDGRSRLEPLTPEQQQLVEQHLALVNHVVFQVAVHFPRHVDRTDLARAGALGLVEAAQRYRADRGVPFEGFAARRIRGAILDATRDADWAPRSVRTLARRLDSVEQQLAVQLGRVPDADEVALELGMSRDELFRFRERVFRSVVLAFEHIVGDVEEGVELVDMLADEGDEPSEALERRELHAYLRDAVHLLPERQRAVVVGYYLEGRSSAELAAFLDVTESRISQIRAEALARLRSGIEGQYDEHMADERSAMGLTARRQAEYVDAIRSRSGFEERLDAAARPHPPMPVRTVPERPPVVVRARGRTHDAELAIAG